MFGLGDKKDAPEQPAADAPAKSAEELEAELRQLAAEVAALEAEEQAAKAAAQEPPPQAKPLRMIGVPMRAPADVSSVSHDGQEFVIPHDRICDVPVAAREAFRGMGFTDVEE